MSDVYWRIIFEDLVDTYDYIFLSDILQPDWADHMFYIHWLNDGWHCCSSRRPVERYADLFLFVLWSLYIDYHPSKEFSLNSRMLRIKHWLLIINMFHKAVTLPIELEKGFFHVGYNYISLFTNSDHIVIIS